MKNKIVLLNTIHYSLDDRVFYHQSKSLMKFGYQAIIISTKEELKAEKNGIIINSYNDNLFTQKEKINEIVNHLNQFTPDIIICDSPLAVIASSIYRKNRPAKIIYDVTEWYPSKKNFSTRHGIKGIFKFIILVVINLYAGFKTDNFIFGEHFKSLSFKFLFFLKKFIYLPYYPDLNYIKQYPQKEINNEINFNYSGLISADKGIDSILNSIRIVARKFSTKQFNLKIIGYFASNDEQIHFEKICASFEKNISITLQDRMTFPDFCNEIGKADLFLDLRMKDFENNHCLPIKLFYYLACGRPVIYSNLRSIKKEIKDFSFGLLSDPTDYQLIASFIEKCITDKNFYNLQCKNALLVSKNKYNWSMIEPEFIKFIQTMI